MPCPPSYGGVIDIFYKINALKACGVPVILHCFQYGRQRSVSLEAVCEKVWYYPRRRSAHLMLHRKPFIVATRSSAKLLERLLEDDYPILFEGLHCCDLLDAPELKNRIKLVRTHNIEHDYYAALAGVEKRAIQRRYFRTEAAKLKRFEKVLLHATHILAISPADAADLATRYPNVHHVMAFHPYEKTTILPGKGTFALYHGNLGVGENNEAALFLVNEIFASLDFPLVIAGSNPSPELQKRVAAFPHITLRAGIGVDEINDLIANAQMNVLPTFQATGIKLKLLAALFAGRHCIVNTPMVANTGLESLCTICDDAATWRNVISSKSQEPFDGSAVAAREAILGKQFCNRNNALKIAELIRG